MVLIGMPSLLNNVSSGNLLCDKITSLSITLLLYYGNVTLNLYKTLINGCHDMKVI